MPESTAYAYEGGMGYPNTLEVSDSHIYSEVCVT